MPSNDPRYNRIKLRLRELEAELTQAGFKGHISKITDVQREIDDLYKELGPKSIPTGTVVKTALKNPNPSRIRVKAQNVTGRIFKPRRKNV